MGLSVYIVAIERGWLSRREAVERTLTVLRFLHASHQGAEADATGYQGFYLPLSSYADWSSGLELRIVDDRYRHIDGRCSYGGELFTLESQEESEIRELAESLYRRVDCNGL